MNMKTVTRALRVFILLTIITGVIYPLGVTAVAQLAMAHRANGSLILDGDHIHGSELIGQPFTNPAYFWARPSATSPNPYNAAASSGSNLGPSNPALADAVKGRAEKLIAAGGAKNIPVDLVTASASGLDPDISPAAARYQAGRVASARGLALGRVQALIDANTLDRVLGVWGERRINVVQLNRALDKVAPLRP